MNKKKTTPQIAAANIPTLRESIVTLRKHGITSLEEARLFCEAASLPEPTLVNITKALGMPFSSASRIAYALEQRGLLAYVPHATDRRKKLLVASLRA